MQESDYRWFLENYAELFNEFGKGFFVIKDKKVLCVCNSYAEGVHEALKSYKPGTFIVQECNGDESAYTVRIASMNFMN